MGFLRNEALKKRVTRFLGFFFLGVALQFSYVNCSVRKPATTGGAQFLTASFKHTGSETTCISCHSGDVPAGAVGPSYTFNHSLGPYGGQGDCISCHMNNLGVSFSGGQFSHSPVPTTCVLCHSGERPTTLVGNPAFDHNLNGQGDCIACHGQSTTAYTSLANWAGGTFMPESLIGISSLSTLAVGIPTFNATTITSIKQITSPPLPLQMLHTSVQIDVTAMNSCTNCHAGANSGNFNPGFFHISNTKLGFAQPTACLDCHTNTMPTGFVGPAGPSRSPGSAEMRHEAVGWVSNGGVWSASGAKIVNQDCAVCHAAGVGNVWSGVTYHASLTKAGLAQPSSCLDCHANSRPTSPVGSPAYSHQNNGGMGDCNACHTPSGYTSISNW